MGAAPIMVADNVQAAEFIDVVVTPLAVDVVDIVAVTEAGLIAFRTIAVADGDGLGEAISISIEESVPTLFVNVSDTVAETEAIAVRINPLTLEVADLAAATEDVQVLTTPTVFVWDVITPDEFIAVAPVLVVKVSDDAIPTEAIQAAVTPLFVAVNDQTVAAEAIAINLPIQVVVSDDQTVSEAVTVSPVLVVQVADASTPTEAVVILQPLTIDIGDAIPVTEAISLAPVLVVVVADVTTPTEALAVNSGNRLVVWDVAQATEAVEIRLPLLPYVAETVVPTEVVEIAMAVSVTPILVGETISVQEAAFLAFNPLLVDLADGRPVGERIWMGLVPKGIVARGVGGAIVPGTGAVAALRGSTGGGSVMGGASIGAGLTPSVGGNPELEQSMGRGGENV